MCYYEYGVRSKCPKRARRRVTLTDRLGNKRLDVVGVGGGENTRRVQSTRRRVERNEDKTETGFGGGERNGRVKNKVGEERGVT